MGALVIVLVAVLAGFIIIRTRGQKHQGMQRVRNDEETEKSDEGDEDDEEEGEEDETHALRNVQVITEVPDPGSVKTFVALGSQVHSIVLPLAGVTSWASLSQGIHDACEDNDLPELPTNGIMHIVLNVEGDTVPVTASTPINTLWSAKAIKVSIADEAAKEEVAKQGLRSRTKQRK